MRIITKHIDKSSLSPAADRRSSAQLNFLLLNHPCVLLINNYKSSSLNLDIMRLQVKQNNGFAYQPNKNIKIRAFKRLSTALSLDMTGGLVVFIFFKACADARSFLGGVKTEVLPSLTYFSILMSGHLITSSVLWSTHLEALTYSPATWLPLHSLNCSCFQFTNYTLYYSLNKLFLILYAYTQPINKRN